MVTHDDTEYLVAEVLPQEQHDLGRRMIPAIDDAGHPIMGSDDGANPVRATARRFLRNVGVVPDGASMQQLAEAIQAPPLLFASSDYELFITDSRVVIVGREVQRDGTRIVGQIRFPWIVSVKSRPKQGFWNDAEIVIQAMEPYDRDGFPKREIGRFEHHFTFVFHKSVKTGDLAAEIVRRASRYVAAQPGVPASPELEALQHAQTLPDPRKGEYAEHWSMVFCDVPEGHFGTDDDAKDPTWHVANT